MAGFPGATGSLVPAHNILSTDMASYVQLPIKKWGMQMKAGPLVFNYCTVSALQLRLMTGSHFAEWKEEERTQERIPPRGSQLRVQEVFTFDFHIYSFPPAPLPLCVSKHEAEKILSIACYTNTRACQLSWLPRPHQLRRRGILQCSFLKKV